MHTIGTRLKEERERLGMTQPAFAEAANAKKRTLIDWEKDVSSPTAVQLAALSSKGVDALYVLSGKRSAAMPAADAAEQVLIDSYRRCGAQAKQNLIQTAALLAAGVDGVNGLGERSGRSIHVSSTHGHAAGRDVNVNSKEEKNGGEGNQKPKRTRSGA